MTFMSVGVYPYGVHMQCLMDLLAMGNAVSAPLQCIEFLPSNVT